MSNTLIRSYQCQKETWYHLPAKIEVTAGHLHKVRFAGIALPHPGLVNWIARRGHPLQTRLELTALHEFGHLQTLPIPLLHLLLLAWPRRGRSPYPGWMRLLFGLLSHQAVWEVASETYVAVHDRRAYQAPRPGRDKALYAIFWSGAAVFSILSTWFILKRET